MSDWCDAKTEKWIDSQRANYVNDAEKKLLSTFKIMYQGGKGTNRMVPVLVPPDCDSALDMLANSEIRKDSDINIRNMFLFPSTKQSLDHCSGWHSVKNVVDAAGVNSHITATAMRHRASTLYASLEIPEDQRLVFFKHMGHTEDINKNVYQCPLGIQEVTKVGSYFASLDGMQVEGTEEPDITGDLEEGNSVEGESSAVSQTPGVEDLEEENSVEGESSTVSQTPGVENLEEGNSVEGESSAVSQTLGVEDDSMPSGLGLNTEFEMCHDMPSTSTKRRKRQYVRWSSSDTAALLTHFKSCNEDTSGENNTGSLPGYKDIEEFLQKENILSGVKDRKSKLRIIHAKLFNERKKFRKDFKKRLANLN
uniref:uncharacterized protein LOC120334077 n=1 Tax=Styela clava TaxID=7725 RepID=UPI00193A8F1E|nr:uncharacterized protein LOC120334077 [Styela clava]